MKTALALALAVVIAPAALAERVPATPGSLQVDVSPKVVEPGQPVTVTLSNYDETRYLLPSGCLFSTVVSAESGRAVRTYLCTANMPILNPRQSFAKAWDTFDDHGDPVALGHYTFPIDVWTVDGRVIELSGTVTVALTAAQSPSCPVEYYGDVGPGDGGIAPELFPLGEAWVGNQDFVLHVQAGLGAAPALLLIGAQGGQVPCSIGMLAVEPGAPWVAVPMLLRGDPGVIGAGVLDVAAPIPNDPALGGLTVYLQVVAEDRASIGGMSHSAGLAVTLCE